MTESLLAASLTIYSLQIGVIVVVAIIGGALMRVPPRRGRLTYWRFVAAVCVLAPWVVVRPVRATPLRLAAEAVTTLTTAITRDTNLASMPLLTGLMRLVWVGMAARLVWLLMGWVRLRALRRHSTAADLGVDIDMFRQRLAPRAEIRFAPGLGQPVTFGWRRPVVLVPLEIGGLSREGQCTVMCHELLHVARRDWLWLWLEEGLRTVFWFHPAMRWAIGQIQLAREEVVDAGVVSLTGWRREYMNALLRFSDRGEGGRRHALEFVRRRHLVLRMRSLSKGGDMSRIRMSATSAALVVFVTGTAWTVGGAASPRRPQQAQQAQQGQQGQHVYAPGNGVSLPVVIKEVHPVYTSEAKAAKLQGTVAMECVVGLDGTANDITIIRSLDDTYGLDDQAVRALKEWRFKPGRKAGEPVAVRVTIEMTFTLK
jgi:TonB family protein